jgi:VanZ family protein
MITESTMGLTKNTVILFRLALSSAVIIILYLTTTPTDYDVAHTINDKLSHALAFLFLSLLADFSFPLQRFSWAKTCPIFAYGLMIECIQYFLPYRSFSLLDIAADTLGIVIYAVSVPLVMRLPVLRQRWLDPL